MNDSSVLDAEKTTEFNFMVNMCNISLWRAEGNGIKNHLGHKDLQVNKAINILKS